MKKHPLLPLILTALFLGLMGLVLAGRITHAQTVNTTTPPHATALATLTPMAQTTPEILPATQKPSKPARAHKPELARGGTTGVIVLGTLTVIIILVGVFWGSLPWRKRK